MKMLNLCNNENKKSFFFFFYIKVIKVIIKMFESVQWLREPDEFFRYLIIINSVLRVPTPGNIKNRNWI